jgi:hypothetical protein
MQYTLVLLVPLVFLVSNPNLCTSSKWELLYRASITLSKVYSETLTAKGFMQESMFQVLCEELKTKSLTMSGFQILALIFLSEKWLKSDIYAHLLIRRQATQIVLVSMLPQL